MRSKVIRYDDDVQSSRTEIFVLIEILAHENLKFTCNQMGAGEESMLYVKYTIWNFKF